MKFIFLIFIFFGNLSLAQTTKIIDGDTIHIGKTKYRFHGIDAPEISQVCTKQNKEFRCGLYVKKKLIEKINNQKVLCKKITTDRYKRIVAECFVNQESLSKYLVRNGLAFAYRKYSKQFIPDEDYAKQNSLGLWSMTFDYPWDYRRKK